ncbi:hypothetical protein [Kitasatospora sp. NPDC088346]|uniref:hypothetical protein n=1 Tax=Kitasatospora sp. NPDC088346 TaxID=3364073 RepID=UPI00381EC4E5
MGSSGFFGQCLPPRRSHQHGPLQPPGWRAEASTHSTTYTYDAAGRPTTVAGADTFTFTYDADGSRVTTRTNGVLSRTLTWDINNPLPQIATETNATGALIGDYTYNPLGQPQSQHNPGGTYYHHHESSHGGEAGSTSRDTSATRPRRPRMHLRQPSARMCSAMMNST